MSLVNVSNMVVLDNPAPFKNPLQFEITFECLQPLEDDLEWKVVYVGSAKSSSHDQILDEILVGPIPLGINKFILQADPPNPSTIPDEDILGVTVILVTCSYREKEFLRVGYYVNNEYEFGDGAENGNGIVQGNMGTEGQEGEIAIEREIPKPLDFDKVVRTILADKPRVTRFQIPWGDEKEMPNHGNGNFGGEGDGNNGREIGDEEDDFMQDDEMENEDEEEDEDEEDGSDDMVVSTE